MRFLYRIFEEMAITSDGEKHKTYGIRAYRKDAKQWVCDAFVEDISSDMYLVMQLAESCTRLELDPVHLRDVVEDAIGV